MTYGSPCNGARHLTIIRTNQYKIQGHCYLTSLSKCFVATADIPLATARCILRNDAMFCWYCFTSTVTVVSLLCWAKCSISCTHISNYSPIECLGLLTISVILAHRVSSVCKEGLLFTTDNVELESSEIISSRFGKPSCGSCTWEMNI